MSDARIDGCARCRPGVPAEGRFFPDTYAYSRGVSDLTVLKRAYDAMQRRLSAAWVAASTPTAAEDRRRGADPGLDRREGNRHGRRPRHRSPACSSTGCASACRCRPTRRVIYGLGESLRRQPAQARPARRRRPTTPTRAPACRRRRSRCRAWRRCRAAVQPERDEGAVFRRTRRRQQRVQRVAGRAQSRGQQVPARRPMNRHASSPSRASTAPASRSHIESLAELAARASGADGPRHARARRYAAGGATARAVAARRRWTR